jgi:two-component system sensor histidine kinase RegB
MIIGEYTLAQAIVTVLDNAADAAPQAVTLQASWNSDTITLQITDAGGGIDPAILASLGDMGISGKPDGLGMGLYLARAVITRLEGRLQITATEGGTTVTITLPCKTVCP